MKYQYPTKYFVETLVSNKVCSFGTNLRATIISMNQHLDGCIYSWTYVNPQPTAIVKTIYKTRTKSLYVYDATRREFIFRSKF